jgi:hypothetical protein
MNPRIYTYELYEQDCVGNDLAKHNFNFLNLESKICNVYTDYFDDANSYVRQVSAFMDKLKELKKFEDLTKYHNIYSTVRILSSYWNKHEFSVLLPNNTQKDKPGFDSDFCKGKPSNKVNMQQTPVDVINNVLNVFLKEQYDTNTNNNAEVIIK